MRLVLGSLRVAGGKGKSLEASVGPAERGEASPPSFAEDLLQYPARPATSERGAACIYIYIYIYIYKKGLRTSTGGYVM